MKTYGLSKKERLKNKPLIKALFESGEHLTISPIKFLWLRTEFQEPYPAQVIFAVPTKTFRKAFERNKIKRLLREAYRLHKPEIYKIFNSDESQYALGLIFISRKKVTFEVICKSLELFINHLKENKAFSTRE
ncbi:MAG: ribonuclease P protein component [Chitinophagaceae bacterium]|nr:MAG: ribonuclease P protein component [Chitinophagaceae bacterium]